MEAAFGVHAPQPFGPAARQAARLQNGQGVPGPYAPEGEVAIVGPGGRAEGLGRVDAEGRLHAQRMFRRAGAETTAD